jgi:translation initiation factor eIF-2B subunit beta
MADAVKITDVVTRRVNQLVLLLKRGDRLKGSLAVSRATAEVLRQIVASTRWSNAKVLIESVKTVGRKLIAAKPLELAIVNTVRRVLHIIREEYANTQLETEEEETKRSGTSLTSSVGVTIPTFSLNSPTTPTPTTPTSSSSGDSLLRRSTSFAPSLAVSTDTLLRRPSARLLDPAGPSLVRVLEADESNAQEDLTRTYSNLKASIVEALQEMIDELSAMSRSIADQAIEHVHANEIIMTFGRSRTVEEFLRTAARKRKFEVIVAESSPSNSGQEMATALSQHGISTTLITDAAIFAMMARVNKVIVGTHAVMANGGLIAQTGIHALALAARHHSVPFVVCAGLYKLCPLYAHDQDTFNELRPPSEVLPLTTVQQLGSEVSVQNPAWDYVPPDLVSLYITNSGGHNPSYIYRLLAEYYHVEDFDL